ncbi:MAG: hypothetical protein L6R42_002374 [Xanthoria sp. 1 TBL-2021]|nr:MAG: hypothetical protein L6R42_002374 [Xanthoria sp. 1 TBL-2021]
MRSLLLITGLAAVLAYSFESVCGPLVTITVTVGAAPTSAPVAAGSLVEPTTTLSSTSFLTSTKIVTVDHYSASEPAQPSSPLDGPYSFAEENGSTIWLGGKTPTSGAALVTNTLVVTLQPQPSSTETVSFTTSSGTTLTSDDQTTTSWTTLSSTSFYTHYLTNLLPAPKPSAYPGNNGWNATVTNLQTLPISAHVTASASSTLKRVHPRQVGALVTATINGVVVTWTNVWAGVPQTTEPSAISTSEPPSPPPIAPGYTWNASPENATTQTSSSAISIVEPTPTFANTTHTSAAITTPESTCGADTGRFTIDFDDLPHFSADAGNTDIPPIFNPYRKLYFNGGFGYVPPPGKYCPNILCNNDPFAPISPPQLAVYNYHTDSSTSQSLDAGLELRGELGAGPRVHEKAYWIDVYSAWIGCANGGPADCRIDLIGYDALNSPIATQTLWQRPCPGLVNCKLAQITFSNQFRDLAGLQILAYVNETPVTFYMDDLSLGWSNNTCAAQFERSSSP